MGAQLSDAKDYSICRRRLGVADRGGGRSELVRGFH